jgi:hypothetical protein
MTKIIELSLQLDAAGIKHDICDYIGTNLKIKTANAENPYLYLTDLSGDIGAVIMTVDDKPVYYYWEGLGGARSSDREWRSTSEFIDEFDLFVLRWHLDTFTPNPYFS